MLLVSGVQLRLKVQQSKPLAMPTQSLPQYFRPLLAAKKTGTSTDKPHRVCARSDFHLLAQIRTESFTQPCTSLFPTTQLTQCGWKDPRKHSVSSIIVPDIP